MSAYDIEALEAKYLRSMSMNGQPGMTPEDIRALWNAMREYRKMSTRFGDILAGTASWLVSLKSTSKSERARQVSICRTAAEMLQTEYGGPERSTDRAWVVKRLNEIVADASK